MKKIVEIKRITAAFSVGHGVREEKKKKISLRCYMSRQGISGGGTFTPEQGGRDRWFVGWVPELVALYRFAAQTALAPAAYLV